MVQRETTLLFPLISLSIYACMCIYTPFASSRPLHRSGLETLASRTTAAFPSYVLAKHLWFYIFRFGQDCSRFLFSPHVHDHDIGLLHNLLDHLGGPGHGRAVDDAVVGAPAEVADVLLDDAVLLVKGRHRPDPADP